MAGKWSLNWGSVSVHCTCLSFQCELLIFSTSLCFSFMFLLHGCCIVWLFWMVVCWNFVAYVVLKRMSFCIPLCCFSIDFLCKYVLDGQLWPFHLCFASLEVTNTLHSILKTWQTSSKCKKKKIYSSALHLIFFKWRNIYHVNSHELSFFTWRFLIKILAVLHPVVTLKI